MMGDKIRKLRNTHNMSQDKVAELLDCDREKISRYENNKITKPDYFFICRLADIFCVDLDYFRKDN